MTNTKNDEPNQLMGKFLGLITDLLNIKVNELEIGGGDVCNERKIGEVGIIGV